MDIFAETLAKLIKTKSDVAKGIKKPRAAKAGLSPEEEAAKAARQDAHLRKKVLTLCNGGGSKH